MTENKFIIKLLAWCPKESLKKSIISRSPKQTLTLKLPGKRRDVRKEILEYIENEEVSDIYEMPKDLDISLGAIARELKALVDKGCVKVYEGGFYSLTREGMRELKMLTGEVDIYERIRRLSVLSKG